MHPYFFRRLANSNTHSAMYLHNTNQWARAFCLNTNRIFSSFKRKLVFVFWRFEILALSSLEIQSSVQRNIACVCVCVFFVVFHFFALAV